jgi:hypothetical protein
MGHPAFDEYVHSVFAADRTGERKGMIEASARERDPW